MINHKKPHLFIAVPIPVTWKQQLHKACLSMKKHYSFRKWVFPADYHITLKFLGAVEQATAQRLNPLMTAIASESTVFPLALEGLGTFGKPAAPRILWTGVQGDTTALHTLQKQIDQSLQPLGFISENRPYHPHVTLSKNYTGHQAFDNAQLEQASANMPKPDQWVVHEIILYQTHLGREPMYEVVETFRLGNNS